MKVVVISAEFPPTVGGIASAARDLVEGLAATGTSVRVLTQGRVNPAGASDVKIARIPPWLGRKYIKVIPMVLVAAWMCVQERPDRVVAMTWTHDGVVAWMLKMLLRVDFAVALQGTEVVQASGWRLWLMRRIFNAARVLIAISGFTRSVAISAGAPGERVFVVHPSTSIVRTTIGIYPNRVDARWGLVGRSVLLTTARLVERKGHADVIRAMAELGSRFPELVYVITGEGPYSEELLRVARELGVEDRLVMVGFVDETELHGLFARADIYVSPSRDDHGDVEGFGLALIEAGSFEIPVIAGRSGGVEDAVVDGVTGFLVEPGDIEGLKDRLVALLEDPAIRKRMGNAARKRVVEEFDPRRQAEKVLYALRSEREAPHARL